MMQLIQDLAFPDKSGRSISSSRMSAQIWQETACPMQLKHGLAIDASLGVTLGAQYDNTVHTRKLYGSLHRVACWAARGNPGPKISRAGRS